MATYGYLSITKTNIKLCCLERGIVLLEKYTTKSGSIEPVFLFQISLALGLDFISK